MGGRCGALESSSKIPDERRVPTLDLRPTSLVAHVHGRSPRRRCRRPPYRASVPPSSTAARATEPATCPASRSRGSATVSLPREIGPPGIRPRWSASVSAVAEPWARRRGRSPGCPSRPGVNVGPSWCARYHPSASVPEPGPCPPRCPPGAADEDRDPGTAARAGCSCGYQFLARNRRSDLL